MCRTRGLEKGQDDLFQQLDSTAVAFSRKGGQVPRKKPPIAARDAYPDDGELFRRAFGDAKPLRQNVIEPVRRRRPARARFSRRDEQAVLAESVQADVEAAENAAGDGLRYQHPSVSQKTMRRLVRGGFSVQAETDLHGLTAAEAKELLLDFIDDCRDRGYTCVRIVHGKGLRSGSEGPVLKRKVDAWLRRWDGILAFVSARQVDGGTGALYVLLKKNR
jgi:DNA-nicking Smr family endonuclease